MNRTGLSWCSCLCPGWIFITLLVIDAAAKNLFPGILNATYGVKNLTIILDMAVLILKNDFLQ